jgi:hypothetical protein
MPSGSGWSGVDAGASGTETPGPTAQTDDAASIPPP